MGAMLRFKEETGRDVTEMQTGVSDMCVYLWCCIKGACAREKTDFPYKLMEFADAVDAEALNAWAAAVNAGKEAEGDAAEAGAKKKAR